MLNGDLERPNLTPYDSHCSEFFFSLHGNEAYIWFVSFLKEQLHGEEWWCRAGKVSPSSSPQLSESGSRAAEPVGISPEPTTKKSRRCNNLEFTL
ncbi:hypothetical protein Bca4012_036841 [Brassica carinata]|uniref:Uncharacterized protein n=1 Tax=Brassica carinata TaxID=52824 RepID=A0A8X7WE33_BRACI|nr:hypothetical protein Bca52824_010549 [Brassica carinata]